MFGLALVWTFILSKKLQIRSKMWNLKKKNSKWISIFTAELYMFIYSLKLHFYCYTLFTEKSIICAVTVFDSIKVLLVEWKYAIIWFPCVNLCYRRWCLESIHFFNSTWSITITFSTLVHRNIYPFQTSHNNEQIYSSVVCLVKSTTAAPAYCTAVPAYWGEYAANSTSISLRKVC